MTDRFIEQLKPYENKWVALDDETKEVVGSGQDAAQALREAEHRGHKDPTLFKVLPFRGAYVPLA
ncbi:MAG: hypothetical protein A3A27_00780 [Candidatus Wildermuthbacteria bacterium RIFCSPLOWO2_01_FULL_47_18]|uniref:DUF5678 domain-containing protein n=1 Tax=Candidatus Wildermuthbacteria bacterium RIFCSPLOWO2_01_FULL_47_18 TaxID=1802460 RepID=A0A1G2RKV1_9BACT|nr:MAG: hypothetical protein A3A27_00780 [Candidatus Wildermuthbacteria bacterium RIFCSPLOWO2_01_FULL_47_18]OHB18337.1 MAG: hypothetical protein A2749_02155 [Parcubacteria group bacterium RIFCSPHIGHO2_01_FULL_45_26]